MHRIVDRLRRSSELFVAPKAAEDYVGSYDVPLQELEELFLEEGLTPNPVSFVSYRVGIGHEVSTFAWRKSRFAKWQYHFVLFSYWNGIRVYCHKEYNWIRHPVLHLRQKDIDCPEGVHWGARLLRDGGFEGQFIPDPELR